jgi:hypothetical protein
MTAAAMPQTPQHDLAARHDFAVSGIRPALAGRVAPKSPMARRVRFPQAGSAKAPVSGYECSAAWIMTPTTTACFEIITTCDARSSTVLTATARSAMNRCSSARMMWSSVLAAEFRTPAGVSTASALLAARPRGDGPWPARCAVELGARGDWAPPRLFACRSDRRQDDRPLMRVLTRRRQMF